MSSPPSGSAADFSGDSGDEYEENVRKQRAENAALLRSLDLDAGGSSIVDPAGARNRRLDAAAEERKKKRAAASRAKAAEDRKRRKVNEAAAGPQRTSARLAGRTPAGMEEDAKRAEQEREEAAQRREEAKAMLYKDHNLQGLVAGGANGGEESREKAEQLEAALRVIAANKERAPRSGLGDAEAKTHGDKATKELSSMLDKMELLAVKKVTPKRIYTAAFHPTTAKTLVFTGDKEGHLSVWEPLAARQRDGDEADDGDDDDRGITGDDGVSWNLRVPQDSSPISCLKIPPLDHSTVFYSSYNSTLRKVDLEKGVSERVFAFASEDDDTDGALLSVFDFQRGAEDGRVVWCGDHRGGVVRVDTREKPGWATGWKRWQLCEKKIGGLSLNPVIPSALAVASLDQSIRLFDIRRLSSGIKPIRDVPANYKAVDVDLLAEVQSTVDEGGAQLGHKQSRQASTSVDFAPDGRHLAAVSYDDVVKVWDLERAWLRADEEVSDTPARGAKRKSAPPPKKEANGRKGGLMQYFKKEEQGADEALTAVPSDILSNPLVIPHNNQTGKWLTLLRARWSQNPDLAPHWTIGSMTRSAEIYSADGRLLRSLYDEEHVSAVPAVTALHPSKGATLVTGNASGKSTFWGLREE